MQMGVAVTERICEHQFDYSYGRTYRITAGCVCDICMVLSAVHFRLCIPLASSLAMFRAAWRAPFASAMLPACAVVPKVLLQGDARPSVKLMETDTSQQTAPKPFTFALVGTPRVPTPPQAQ